MTDDIITCCVCGCALPEVKPPDGEHVRGPDGAFWQVVNGILTWQRYYCHPCGEKNWLHPSPVPPLSSGSFN